MTEAARRTLRVRDGLAAVAEWEAQHGAFTDAELDEARKRLRQKSVRRLPSRRSRRR
jgi:hypothetical protein